jgi:RNA polymerase sigma-70 factor (TIGR02960 family)
MTDGGRARYTGMTITQTEEAMAETDFDEMLERHRRELHVHCYRMLGSFTDAEDLVQETFLRAWRHRDQHQPGSNLRAWLYRIATNACTDVIRSRRRQVQRAATAAGPAAGTCADVPWLQPYPDALLDQLEQIPDPAAGPETATIDRETIELAFITAIQALPPRQRAALVLCGGLGWTAAEAAATMQTSTAAVNSALQRARVVLRDRLPRDRSQWTATPLSAAEQDVLRQFIEAHERGDAAAARAVMGDGIVATMPPQPLVFRGRAAMEELLVRAFAPPAAGGMGEWRALPTAANRWPAAACYLRRPGDTVFRAFKLDVLRIKDDLVVETTTFGSDLFAAFGLPEILPDS